MSDTDAERELRIRERAYFFWLEAGCPDGRSDEFWNRAQMLDAGPFLPVLVLPSSAQSGGTAGGVARGGRRTDPVARPAASPIPSSSTPSTWPAPPPLSLLFTV